MIEKRGRTITDFFTGGTRIVRNGQILKFLPTMLTHEVEDSIRFGKSLIGTARAFERGRVLFRMFGGDMDGERLCMEKLLFTGWTRMRQMSLMFLHMIVHGVLVLLDLGTDSTNKLAGSILLIDVRHVYRTPGTTGLQFFVGMTSIASRSDCYDRHSSRLL